MVQRISSYILSILMTVAVVFGIGVPEKTVAKSFDIRNDVSYGEDLKQKFDIIIPEGLGNELSLAVYIHGGAWMGGDKAYDTEIYQSMATQKGMVSANLNYRLLDESKKEINLQSQLQDINTAIGKIVEICNNKGIKIKKTLICGESAGAHLALMYSYTWREKCPVEIGLCYSICGPTDLTDMWYFTDGIIPSEKMIIIQSLLTSKDLTFDNLSSEEIKNALFDISPVKYVDENVVPTIFNSCELDKYVPLKNAVELEEALKANSVDYYYDNFEFSSHCGRNGLDYYRYVKLDNQLDKMINKYVK